jgi:hypothetical protein
VTGSQCADGQGQWEHLGMMSATVVGRYATEFRRRFGKHSLSDSSVLRLSKQHDEVSIGADSECVWRPGSNTLMLRDLGIEKTVTSTSGSDVWTK